MANKIRNIPLSLDDELLAEIDQIAENTKESRSGVMRKAIREGLCLVKAGGSADVLTLDSELSADVNTVAQETDLRRQKVILESIRTGLQAFGSKTISAKMSLAGQEGPEKIARLNQLLEESYRLYDDPMVKEHRKALLDRGAMAYRLNDLLDQVPEAKRRHEAMMRLASIRNAPGGGGGGMPWGLSTEELEWQIRMSEKYGALPSDWPEEEKLAHQAAS